MLGMKFELWETLWVSHKSFMDARVISNETLGTQRLWEPPNAISDFPFFCNQKKVTTYT